MLQVNLNRCHIAHDLLEVRVREHQVDVVIASEPNNKRAGADWVRDSCDGDVAIFLNRASSRIATARGGPGKRIVWVKIGDIAVIACYFDCRRGL